MRHELHRHSVQSLSREAASVAGVSLEDARGRVEALLRPECGATAADGLPELLESLV